jgi:Taurine catabolism dioxygenase TauD, TfdA family
MGRLASLPDTATIDVSRAVANQLLGGAESLPRFDNKEFYSSDLQKLVHSHVREACSDGFDRLVDMIGERIARWPYCVLIRGLRFDEGNKVFVAINRAFGELVARPYEKPRAQLVHYIQPATDLLSAQGGHESERLHTDTADWEPPVELISMVCVRADHKGGGRSQILDVDTIRDEVRRKLGSGTLQRLESEQVPWQLAPYLGVGLKWRSVLTGTSVCWRRYTINLALECEQVSLTNEMLATLDAFENVIAGADRTIEFLMREGELLFSDNHRTIHARTPISDGVASNRLMIRSWIRVS